MLTMRNAPQEFCINVRPLYGFGPELSKYWSDLYAIHSSGERRNNTDDNKTSLSTTNTHLTLISLLRSQQALDSMTFINQVDRTINLGRQYDVRV